MVAFAGARNDQRRRQRRSSGYRHLRQGRSGVRIFLPVDRAIHLSHDGGNGLLVLEAEHCDRQRHRRRGARLLSAMAVARAFGRRADCQYFRSRRRHWSRRRFIASFPARAGNRNHDCYYGCGVAAASLGIIPAPAKDLWMARAGAVCIRRRRNHRPAQRGRVPLGNACAPSAFHP